MNIQDIDPGVLNSYLNGNGKTGVINRRLFEVVVRVKFESELPRGEWDRGLIDVYLKRRVKQVLVAILEDEHPEWNITLELLGKFKGENYDTDARSAIV